MPLEWPMLWAAWGETWLYRPFLAKKEGDIRGSRDALRFMEDALEATC